MCVVHGHTQAPSGSIGGEGQALNCPVATAEGTFLDDVWFALMARFDLTVEMGPALAKRTARSELALLALLAH